MGLCFSCCCCRRRDKRDKHEDEERQRLLRPEADPDTFKHPEERTPYEKVADVLATLHAGKLPSQGQLNTALQKLLRSEFLDIDLDSETGETGEGGTLDESVRRAVMDAREVAESILQVGLEKNDDDRVQDLVYQLQELSTQIVPIDVKDPPEVEVDQDTLDKVQTAASAIPSQNEVAEDLSALISSLRTLAKLLLTSSAFRLIVGDLLLTVREIVADAAAHIKQVAETVENVSEAVERYVRPGAETIDIAQPIPPEEPSRISSPNPGRTENRDSKEAILDRIEDIFRRAQASPQYNSALRTLFYIFRKYAERVRIASTAISEATQSPSGHPSVEVIAPVIVPDPRFSRAPEDLKVIVERFADGKSLNPVLQALFKAILDISVVAADSDSSDIQVFFGDVGSWLDNALANPSFVTSRTGRDVASNLYDRASSLLSKDARLSENVNVLLDEVDSFVDALKSDRSTSKLLQAINNFHMGSLTLLGQTTESSKQVLVHWRTTLLRAFLGWLLPRILRIVRVLPMPRVEYVSRSSNGAQFAVAVDALLLSAEEALVPDVLNIQELSEIRVEIDENVGAAELTSPNARLLSTRRGADRHQDDDLEERHLTSPLPRNGTEDTARISNPRAKKRTSVMTTSRTRVHIEGLRIAARDVAYYASYARNSWLGYTDEGLLSIDIGRGGRHRQHRGEGLAVDVEIEMDSDLGGISASGASGTKDREEERLFRVVDVQTAIPDLAMHITHSRHWILNSVLAPLVGPIGRTVVPWIVNAQVKSALESLEEVLRDVKSKAAQKAQNRAKENQNLGMDVATSASDWWDALLERFSSQCSEEDSDEEEEEQQEVYTETHTEATLTGVVRTTLEQPEPEPQNEVPPATENVLSVGLGAQLLPGKGEPTSLGIDRESPQEAAQEIAETAREAVEDLQGKVQHIEEGVKHTGRKGIEEAIRVRRLAEDAEERMENQERREKRRKGWRSRAFDL